MRTLRQWLPYIQPQATARLHFPVSSAVGLAPGMEPSEVCCWLSRPVKTPAILLALVPHVWHRCWASGRRPDALKMAEFQGNRRVHTQPSRKPRPAYSIFPGFRVSESGTVTQTFEEGTLTCSVVLIPLGAWWGLLLKTGKKLETNCF